MTRYCVTLKIRKTGNTWTTQFDSMTERVLYVLQTALLADVVREWLATDAA